MEKKNDENRPSAASYPLHVKLPFDLRDPNIKINNVWQTLSKVFPETVCVTQGGDRVYLAFEVRKWPRTPWPLTVGGLPITIERSGGDDKQFEGKGPMFPRATPGNMSIRVCNDLDARSVCLSSQGFRNLADAVTPAVMSCVPNLPIVEYILSAEKHFYIVLRDDVDITAVLNQLPGRVAKCWTTYLSERDLHRPFDVDENIPRFTEILEEAPDDEIAFGSEVFLNSPYAGLMTGIAACKSWRITPKPSSHPIVDSLKHVVYEWAYLGQNTANGNSSIPDIVCGSALRNKLGRVTGFFRYHIEEGKWKGFCVSVAADEVAKAGYKLG